VTNPGTVKVERRNRILVITLCREEKRNALDASIAADLESALNELEDDSDLWCGVLTGGPSFFSAGNDLTGGIQVRHPRGGYIGLIHRKRSKPLIAAVEGFALGGGMELCLCCDLVVAARDARFGMPEVKRGVISTFGGAFRVMRMLPPNVGRELTLTGDPIGAERLERLGFVNVLSEPGHALDDALALAERVTANSPFGVGEHVQLAQRSIEGDESELWNLNDAALERVMASDDAREGVRAFLEKRPPIWVGH
jgi:enoyl-CoA hydratase/carnithine racemase